MAKTGETKITDIATIPFSGGMDTRRERALVTPGTYSDIQNIRNRHPGFEQRLGMKRKHTTADSTNQAMSGYQFSKGRTTERHFFAQMSDGDVLKATHAPPTVTTGAFGAEFHSGTTKASGMLPASWSDVNDLMVYSNGKEQHQVYAGDDNYVWGLIKYDAAAAPPNVPKDGFDYTLNVTDGLTTTGATLDDLDTYANNECLFICSPVPITKITWTFSGTKVNTAAAVGTLSYRKSDNSWADTEETDGTITGSDTTLGQSGSMTWSQPSDEISCYMYGQSAFWYLWETDTQLTDAAGITVTSLTYGHNAEFVDVVNAWDGSLQYITEVQHFDNSATTDVHYTYPGDNIILSGLEHTNDKLYFSFPDRLQGIYVDVGISPNNPDGATAITAIYYWDGDSFASVGTVTDETNGFINSGWVTWAQKASEPHQFNGSQYYAHWYYIVFGTASFSTSVSAAFTAMPYFDISELGDVSLASCSWKGRCAMTFDKFPSYVYLPSNESPMMLNGFNYGILQAGDGRNNRAIAMRRFYNEMIVWQQEKGLDGGCTTMFQGYSPDTYGKLVLSSTVGTFSNKSVVVVDGIRSTASTEDEEVKSFAFWLSNYGVIASDGRAVSIVSDPIQNYFDPADSNSLRRGYDSEHWIGYDSMYNCLRVGLVTGSTSAIPNTFLSFDLVEKAWSHDELFADDATAGLSFITEVEAASGDIPILQYGGGVDDGCIYQLNTGTDDKDVSDTTHAVDSYATMELSHQGKVIQVGGLVLRTKVQSAGSVTVTPSKNGVEQTALGALSMTAENSNELMRRNKTKVGTQDSSISLKFQNATAGQSMYLLDVGMAIYEKPSR